MTQIKFQENTTIAMDAKSHLSTIPLFQQLPREGLGKLAAQASVLNLSRGDALFAEGDTANGFYVVLSGKVKVYKLSPEGKEQILHLFAKNQPVGEAAVFAGESFPAHATALEKSQVLFVPRDEFVALLQENPEAALEMLAILSRRLMRFTSLIENLALKEIPNRFAAYVVHLLERNGANDTVDLEMSRRQLASVLGTTPETLSRVTARLEKQGAMEPVGGKKIRVCDRTLFTSLAEGHSHLN